jgi:Arc/MetJ-type ribon-helix-helix transcriptional regulator
MSKTELEFLGVKIPQKLNEDINKAVSRGDYVSKSDLVRAALRLLFEREIA